MGRTVELADPYLGESPATAKYFDEEAALCELLWAEVLFANGRRYLSGGYTHTNPDGTIVTVPERIEPETIVLFVSCNDVFAWGCADAEELPHEEVRRLYEMWKAREHWGATEWCCLRRKMRPQAPVERDMRTADAWTAALEALPPREPKECG